LRFNDFFTETGFRGSIYHAVICLGTIVFKSFWKIFTSPLFVYYYPLAWTLMSLFPVFGWFYLQFWAISVEWIKGPLNIFLKDII